MEVPWVVFAIVLVLVLGAWSLWGVQRTVAVVRDHLTAILAFGVVGGLVAAWRIDDLLQALRPPGGSSYDMGALATFRPSEGREALATWELAQVPGFATAERITGAYLTADTLVAVTSAWLLLRLARSGAVAAERAGGAALTALRGRALPLAVAFGLTDLLENAALLVATRSDEPPGWSFGAAAVLGGLKWLLVLVLVLLVVVPRLAAAVQSGERARRWRHALGAVRLQIIVVVIYAVLLHGPIAGPQSADVLLRWVQFEDAELIDAIIGIVFTLWLGGVTYAAARTLLVQDQFAPAQRIGSRRTMAIGVALVAGGLIALVMSQPPGLVVLGGLVVLYGTLALIEGEPRVRGHRLGPPGRLPLVIGAVPAASLGLAMQSAAIGELVYAGEPRLWLLLAFGAVLQLAAWVMVTETPSLDRFVSPVARQLSHRIVGGRPEANLGVILSAGALGLLAVRIWTDPWRVSDLLGTVAIFAAFCTAASLIAFAVAQFDHRHQPPAVLAALGIQRHPVLIGLAVWMAIVFALGVGPGYHDARVQPTGTALGIATVEDVWTRWKDGNGLDAPAAVPPGRRRATPLVLVATSGGGIRAAYWTANSLDRVFGPDRAGWPSVFAISGASGGSVGSAFYAARILRGEDRADWVEHRLGADHLAPTWASTLFADVPQGFGLLDVGHDRAEVLERSLEQSWTGRDALGGILGKAKPSSGPLATGLRGRWNADASVPPRRRLPLFLFNATSVQDGCRINVSVLDADLRHRDRAGECLSLAALDRRPRDRARPAAFGATEDVVDVLCNSHDVRLSTASMLSARFPFVTPSGRLDDCDEDASSYAVDGGYFDNTGASALTELWTAVSPRVQAFNEASEDRCVVPVFLQLDNTYEQVAASVSTRPPPELAAPLLTVLRVIGIGPGREASAKQNAGVLFDRPSAAGVKAYARIFPTAHPGTSPPLGWTLSRITMKDMDDQLELPHNERAIARVREWLSGGLTCGPRPTGAPGRREGP